MVPPRRNRIIILVACLLLLSGCAALGPAAERYSRERNTLIVQNRGWDNVTVYVVRGEAAIRIGDVQALSSRVFPLPSSVTGSGMPIQLRGLRRLQDEVFTSPAFDVQPGEEVRWTIESHATLSHVFVR